MGSLDAHGHSLLLIETAVRWFTVVVCQSEDKKSVYDRKRERK